MSRLHSYLAIGAVLLSVLHAQAACVEGWPAPSAPAPTVPVNADVVSCNVGFAWAAPDWKAGDTYELRLGTKPPLATVASELTSASYVVPASSLLADGSYLWQVRTHRCNGLVSAWSPLLGFEVYGHPSPAQPLKPVAGAYTNATPTFSWIGDSDAPNTTYDLYLDSKPIAMGLTSASYTVPSDVPQAHGDHSWMVRTKACLGQVQDSVTASFAVDAKPPEVIGLIGPADETWVNHGPIEFTWAPVVDKDSGVGTTSFVFDGEATVVSGTLIEKVTEPVQVYYDFEEKSQMVDWSLEWPWARQYEGSWLYDWTLSPNVGVSYLNNQDAYATLTLNTRMLSDTDILAGWGTCTEYPYDYVTLEAWIVGEWSWIEIMRFGGDGDQPIDKDITSWFSAQAAGKEAQFRFRFHSNSSGIHSACKGADGAGIWVTYFYIHSPFPTLPEGQHPWQVLATDLVGNTQQSELRLIGLDRTAPSTAAAVADAYEPTATPILTWKAATDTLSGIGGYRVLVDGAEAATVLGNATTAKLGKPLTEGKHAWVVRALDLAENSKDSATATLWVDLTPPTAPVLKSPASGASLAMLVPNLCFSASSDGTNGSGVDRYEVWIDGVLFATVASGGNLCVAAATSEGPHTWSVTAFDRSGHSATSETRTYSTDLANAFVFGKVSPSKDLFVQSFTPNLCWTRAVDKVLVVTGYAISVKNSKGAPIVDTTVPAKDTDVVCWSVLLKEPGIYTWQVSVTDSAGEATPADGGEAWSFEFAPDLVAPSCTLLMPPAGAVVGQPLAASGLASDPAPGVGVDHVEICFDNQCTMGWPDIPAVAKVENGQWQLFWNPADGVHTVGCRAVDANGNVQSPLDVHEFTFDGQGPSAPVFTSPEDGAWFASATPSLTWLPATDPWSPITSVKVLVDGSPFTLPGDATTFTPSPLSEGLHVVTIWGVNQAGIPGIPATRLLGVDLTIPAIEFLQSPKDKACISTSVPSLAWTPKPFDAISYVTQVAVTMDGVTAATLSNDAETWTPSAPLPDGPHKWSVIVTDAAGRTSTSTPRTFTVDTAAPTCAIDELASAGPGKITVKGHASDVGCGVAWVTLVLDDAKQGAAAVVLDEKDGWSVQVSVTPSSAPHTLRCDVAGVEGLKGSAEASFDQGPCFVLGKCELEGACFKVLSDGEACNDGDPCTAADACDASGACAGTPVVCVTESGACAPIVQCDGTAVCDAAYPPSGSACDDGNACTFGDHCDGMGACVTQSLTCTDDPGPCGAHRACDGTASCAVSYPSPTTPCDDGNPCTSDDHCDGPAGCGGTGVTCKDDPPPCGVTRWCNGTQVCTEILPGPDVDCTPAPEPCHVTWGYCSGGSCVADGTLPDETPCGDLSECLSGVCDVAPPGDTCADAIPLAVDEAIEVDLASRHMTAPLSEGCSASGTQGADGYFGVVLEPGAGFDIRLTSLDDVPLVAAIEHGCEDAACVASVVVPALGEATLGETTMATNGSMRIHAILPYSNAPPISARLRIELVLAVHAAEGSDVADAPEADAPETVEEPAIVAEPLAEAEPDGGQAVGDVEDSAKPARARSGGSCSAGGDTHERSPFELAALLGVSLMLFSIRRRWHGERELDTPGARR